MRRAVSLLVGCAIAACGASRPPAAPPPPYACAKVDVPPVNGGRPGAPCAVDADCRAQRDGRCVTLDARPHAVPVVACIYDECASDRDCAPQAVCACGSGRGPSRNRCVPGNCHADADCGGRSCDESRSTFGPQRGARAVEGKFCRTREDQCRADRDCDLEGRSACAYRRELGRWTCVPITYAEPD